MTEIRQFHRLTDAIRARSFSPRRSDRSLVSQINRHFSQLDLLSNDQLTAQAQGLRARVASGASVFNADIVVPAFALVKEAARRTIGQEHYDVQLLAGLALATGAIAQMQTGEGKTLASTLPAVLHGLAGRGVHVATVNPYLAQRDFDLLRPIYTLLAVSVGHAREGDSPQAKRAAYACDVTYSTGYELGFDYLRDQVALRQVRYEPVGRRVRNGLRSTATETGPIETGPIETGPIETGPIETGTVQRGHAFVVIDEVDSVLIDEANTPLILSAPSENQKWSPAAYHLAKLTANLLIPDVDFIHHTHERRVTITEAGANKAHARMPRLSHELARPWLFYVEQAVRAKYQYQRDVNYIVRDNRIRIVDEYTGRIFTERSWRDGLHQAIEAKEAVPITEEKRSIARISRQRYFQMYDRVCGMTGTAIGHEQEFYRFYNVPVVSIPLRTPCRRQVLPTRYFATEEDKWSAIASEILQRHRGGQPVLVGTRTIANSNRLATLLMRAGAPFRLLNGVQDENEAALIAAAGERSAITIATNMAGRGTDVKPTQAAIEHGGLHVIAAERHDSQRIDRQLAGRAARQGDPGSCQFFVSAEDQLIRENDPALATRIENTCDGAQQNTNSPKFGRSRSRVAGVERQRAPSGNALGARWRSTPATLSYSYLDVEITTFDSAIGRIQTRTEAISYEKRVQLMNHEIWLDELRTSVA